MILCSSAASREGLLHCEEKPCGCACASTLTLASCVGALTLEVDRYPLVATNCNNKPSGNITKYHHEHGVNALPSATKHHMMPQKTAQHKPSNQLKSFLSLKDGQ